MPRDTDSTKPEPPSSSPFEELPAELRNAIYSLLLIAPGHLFITARHKMAADGSTYFYKLTSRIQTSHWDFTTASPELHCSGLLRVNKQIHREAMSVLYGENSFKCASPDLMRRFLQRVGPGLMEIGWFRESEMPRLKVRLPGRERLAVDALACNYVEAMEAFVKEGRDGAGRRRRFEMIDFGADVRHVQVREEVEKRFVAKGLWLAVANVDEQVEGLG